MNRMPDKANPSRDEVLRRMLKTPPQPHKPLGIKKTPNKKKPQKKHSDRTS
jgi:hypothetical protein